MNLKNYLPVCLLFIISCQNASTVKTESYKWPEGVTAPVAEKKAKEFAAHGDIRIDNYYWMNDFFKKGPDSTKVVEYLKAENSYLDTMLSGTKEIKGKFVCRVKSKDKRKR